jgi:hypothetical protein
MRESLNNLLAHRFMDNTPEAPDEHVPMTIQNVHNALVLRNFLLSFDAREDFEKWRSENGWIQ